MEKPKRILLVDDNYIEVSILELRCKHPIEWLPVVWPLESLGAEDLKKWDMIIVDFRGTTHHSIVDFYNNLNHPRKVLTSSAIPIEVQICHELGNAFVLKEYIPEILKAYLDE